MLSLKKPDRPSIERFLEGQRRACYSYDDVGATSGDPPRGYVVDRNRVRLGEGLAVYESACALLSHWQMFRIPWLQLCWPEASIETGTTVAVVTRVLGVWWINACRIVSVIDEVGPVARFGFAYGTLLKHAESGEERFSVEWRREDDSVWYDILAFSRPNHPLVWMAYPVARRLQKRFAKDSLEAMRRAVAGAECSVR